MDQPHSTAFSRHAQHLGGAAALRQEPAYTPAAPDVPMRKYEVMYLDRDGQLQETRRMARAHAAYEHAFSVLKQGAMVKSKQGHMPVEDVLPGDQLRLADGTYETVQWRGCIQVDPNNPDTNEVTSTLTRFAADAMGFNRPSPDLVLGNGARIMHRAPGIRRVSGSDAAYMPAADFVDSNNVMSLQPPAPFALYQFGFDGQRGLEVNGVEVETLHPGTAFNLGLRGPALRAYLGLFPHKRSFEDFGMLDTPRLRMRDLELLD